MIFIIIKIRYIYIYRNIIIIIMKKPYNLCFQSERQLTLVMLDHVFIIWSCLFFDNICCIIFNVMFLVSVFFSIIHG